jgi:hypothetical protein
MSMQAPVCQSCGMVIRWLADEGTDASGHLVTDYCHHCFAGGSFIEPWISMQEMVDRSAKRMTEWGIMPSEEATALMCETIPKLRRWREARRGHFAPT